jgi:hypothetical protein
MSSRRFHVYAPLQDFQWSGSDFALAPGISIRRFQKPPDLAGMHEWLSKEEWERASGASHWLTHEVTAGVVPSAGEVENLFLLSLWLVKPHRAQIAFRFEIGLEGAEGNKSRQRLLDRFMWVPGSIHLDFETVDLQSAAQFYGTLAALCSARLRLNDALLLTLSGCWSHAWQVSLICHAAAAEAILTYSTGPGITRRLATAFACLTESQATKRDLAFREFTSLYLTRSDIMHGRTHNVAVSDRLPTLVRFQDLLRKLWTAVCSSPPLIQVLEGSDAQREIHFKAIQQGYTPPP